MDEIKATICVQADMITVLRQEIAGKDKRIADLEAELEKRAGPESQ